MEYLYDLVKLTNCNIDMIGDASNF